MYRSILKNLSKPLATLYLSLSNCVSLHEILVDNFFSLFSDRDNLLASLQQKLDQAQQETERVKDSNSKKLAKSSNEKEDLLAEIDELKESLSVSCTFLVFFFH